MNKDAADAANLQLVHNAIAFVQGRVEDALVAIPFSTAELLELADLIPGGFPMPSRFYATARESIIGGLCELHREREGYDL